MPNHHYVPEFYLKRFCDPSTPPRQEPYLWVSARGGTEWRKRAPKNVAYEPGLYSIPSRDGDPEVVEKMFGTIESAMADIYRRRFDILEGPVGRKEREVFATFLALFIVRSPFFRENLKRISEELAQMSLRMGARQPDVVLRGLRSYEEKTGKKAGLTIEQYQDAVFSGRVKPMVHPHFITAMSLKNLAWLMRIIFIMRWRFLIAPRGECFATADSPAQWQDLTPRPPMLQGHGLAMRNVELVLPLSRRFCFLGRWGRSTGVVMASPTQVREITNRTISWSTAEVYSPLPFKKVLLDGSSTRPIYPLVGANEPRIVRPPIGLSPGKVHEDPNEETP